MHNHAVRIAHDKKLLVVAFALGFCACVFKLNERSACVVHNTLNKWVIVIVFVKNDCGYSGRKEQLGAMYARVMSYVRRGSVDANAALSSVRNGVLFGVDRSHFVIVANNGNVRRAGKETVITHGYDPVV